MKSGCALRSAIARLILFFDGFDVVIRILSTPLATIASASLSLAQQMPIDPLASWYFAIAAHLCVLACGRLGSPFFFSVASIVAIFFSILSRSTQSAGVSSSHFETPPVRVHADIDSLITPRGFAPRTPLHALSRPASSARSGRVARVAVLARVFLCTALPRRRTGRDVENEDQG